jgi:C_GCAxxG_C_C family probable redox protein
MIKNKEEQAIVSFRSGLNCAQSMVTAYSDELNLDETMALSISCGFGGGMGRLQQTCGAVTGSYMILGVYTCKKISENSERKEQTYKLVRNFNEKFKQINGSTDCLSLLKCEIQTDEGHRYAKENNLFEKVCEKCISDSIRIIDSLV